MTKILQLIFLLLVLGTGTLQVRANSALRDSLFHFEQKADQLQRSDPSQAIEFYTKALHYAELLNDSSKQAEQFHKRGWVQGSIGLNGLAIESYRQARGLYNALKLSAKTGWVLLDIGNVYYKQEEKRSIALEHYSEALQLFQQSKDKDGEIVALNNMGLAHLMLDQLEQAVDVYHQAEQAALTYQDTLRLIFTYSYLADAHRFLDKQAGQGLSTHKHLSLAHQYLAEGLSLATATGNDQGLAQIYEYYGSLYSHQNQYDSALVYFKRALNQYQQLGNVKMQALQMELFAEQFSKMGDVQGAIVENERLLAFAQENGLRNTELAATLRLANFYAQVKQFDRSTQMFAKGSELNQQFQDELSAAQLQYEQEIQQKQLELINKEMEIKAIELGHQRTLNTGLLVGSGLLLIALSIIFINLKKQQRTNKILVKRHLEIAQQQRSARTSSSDDRRKQSALSPELKEDLFSNIKSYLSAEQPYRQATFKIEDLAQALNTNRNYLSQTVNEQSGTNFSNFINEYRIQDAMRELIDPENSHLTIEAIAGLVGFKSKSAFNTAFKKYSGVTPSAFIQGKQTQQSQR